MSKLRPTVPTVTGSAQVGSNRDRRIGLNSGTDGSIGTDGIAAQCLLIHAYRRLSPGLPSLIALNTSNPNGNGEFAPWFRNRFHPLFKPTVNPFPAIRCFGSGGSDEVRGDSSDRSRLGSRERLLHFTHTGSISFGTRVRFLDPLFRSYVADLGKSADSPGLGAVRRGTYG